MHRDHFYKVQAVILSRRNFAEKDRILTLFSLERGKIDVLAKGARRPGSKLSYVSDLGTLSNYQISKTRSLDIVTEAKTVFIPDEAFGDLEKSNRIFYSLKVIAKLYHEDEPYVDTFRALVDLIRSSAESKNQLNFLVFLKHVISDLGINPELKNCIFCGEKITADDEFDFNLKGGMAHRRCDSGDRLPCSISAGKFLRLLFTSNEVGQGSRISDAVFAESYFILKSYLGWHTRDLLPDEPI